MGLLFMDGFDNYNNPYYKWDLYSGSGNYGYSTSDTRFSSGQLLWLGNNGFSNRDIYFEKSIPNTQTFIMGAAVKLGSLVNSWFMGTLDTSSSWQVLLYHDATGHLYVTRNATQITSASTSALVSGVWYYIEWKCKIDPTVGYVIVKVNGVEWLNATGLNTRNTANSYINKFRIYQNMGVVSATNFDDLYMCDDQGTRLNDFLGDVRIYPSYPSAAGTYSQFTPSAGANYTDVDEAGMNTGDTDYVATATVGNKDSYNFGDIAGTVTILAVIANYVARKDDAGARFVKPFARIGSTDYEASTAQTLYDSYWLSRYTWTLSPATGVAWTQSEFNAAEFGLKVDS